MLFYALIAVIERYGRREKMLKIWHVWRFNSKGMRCFSMPLFIDELLFFNDTYTKKLFS